MLQAPNISNLKGFGVIQACRKAIGSNQLCNLRFRDFCLIVGNFCKSANGINFDICNAWNLLQIFINRRRTRTTMHSANI